MHIDNAVDPDQARQQFDNLITTYATLGVPVRQIKPNKGLPDMVYTANFGFAQDGVFVPAQFKYAERQAESDYAIEFFKSEGFEIRPLPEGIVYEGEGDHLRTPDGRHFMGYGKRTDKQAAEHLAQLLAVEVIPLELINPYFYHLDTAFSPLTDDIALINPESFTSAGIKTLHDHFPTVIETNKQDNTAMAPNLLRVNQDLLMAEGISEELQNTLAELGFTIHTVATTEFLKGGGSIKCLSMQVYE